ncbi:MAG TPA: hypothetical protein DCX08_13385 [Porticoccaceae bacterium]|jgi:protein-S-isoprenylcysteine O-methyltransferase Ste14|nr:hypothetical protein [Porticoccaceae bacterium]
MDNKIPPPIVALVCGLIIFFSKHLFPIYEHQSAIIYSVPVLFLGVIILALAALSFRKYSTSLNPLAPEKASSLVTSGIFGYSRNPMYLGMLLILVSIAITFNVYGGFIMSIIFLLFITRFQIIPEEAAMEKLFTDEFLYYKKRTRRWI